MSLLKSTGVVSAFTLLSRITGLLRESLLAYFFGASAATDAFNVAFRIPNLLRRIFAEGAFSQAFVPLLAEAKVQGGDAATKELVNGVSTLLFSALLLTVLIGIVAAPALVWVMASGLQQKGEAFDIAVVMTRIMFPYILCMSLVALMSAVLNTYKRFAIPAFTPVLLNLCMIAAAALGIPHLLRLGLEPVYALAIGAMLGGVLQVGVQWWAVWRLGLHPSLGLRWSALRAAAKRPQTRRMLRLMGPALLGVSVAQISLLINTQIASHLQAGSLTWLSMADRLMEFPTAMVGVALGVVLMPTLAKARASGENHYYSQTLDWGLRLVFLLGLPCSIALWAFAKPLVTLLFHYGAFTFGDVEQTARAVQSYGVGLLGLLAIKILAPAYYANQNTKTPVKIAVLVLILTQLMNLVLVPHLAIAGLALSIAIGALVNASWLLTGLVRSKLFHPQKGWLLYLARLAFANGILLVTLWWLGPELLSLAQSMGKLQRAGLIVAACAAAGLTYILLLYCTGMRVHRVLLGSQTKQL